MNKKPEKQKDNPAPPLKAEFDDEAEVKELVRKIKNGSDHAFTELTDRYFNQVASVAFKMVSDYDEAADIAQSVFVKVSKNIWRYDEKKKFYTWLYRITVNASIDHMRKSKRHRHESLDIAINSLDTQTATPEVSFQRKELMSHIKTAAKKLNKSQRSAFFLRDIEGNRINDVATMMEMPEATVRWYVHRARQKVKKELLKKCPKLLIIFGIK